MSGPAALAMFRFNSSSATPFVDFFLFLALLDTYIATTQVPYYQAGRYYQEPYFYIILQGLAETVWRKPTEIMH